jgi:hypothetical protein
MYVLAIDHSPALVVLDTDDEKEAFAVAVKYAALHGSRTCVARVVHGDLITPDQARDLINRTAADEALKRAALDAEARENEAAIAALVAGAPIIEVVTPSDDGVKANAGKRR